MNAKSAPRLAGAVAQGVKNHGLFAKKSGRACSRPLAAPPPSGCPPTNVKRGGSRAGGRHNGPLRAPRVGDHCRLCARFRQVIRGARCSAGRAPPESRGRLRRERSGRRRRRRWRAPHRRLEHVFVVHSDHERVGQISRAASAIDPPMSPRPTIPIRGNTGRCSQPSGLVDDWKFHGSYQLARRKASALACKSEVSSPKVPALIALCLDPARCSKPAALSLEPPSTTTPSPPGNGFETDASADRRRDDSQFGHQAVELCREHRCAPSLSA